MKIILLVLVFIQFVFAQIPLTTQTSANFSGSGVCVTCHESNGTVLTWNNTDISPATHWRSTMMSNAAEDPLWRAKVSAEVIENPQLQSVIETKCTTCHAPMGNRQAIINGQTDYSIAEMESSDLAKDGVSCTVCHQIQNTNFGHSSSFSGGFDIGLNRIINGPYQSPLTSPMYNTTSFLPAYADYINESELCATCHTLYTPYVDNSGNVAGTFPEQVPYLEWKNSDYPNQGTECQTCHMPQINDPIDISTIPPWHTTTHSPFWQHHFVGGNVFILEMLKNNIDTLELSASTAHFDSTISRTSKQLTENTVNLDLNTYTQSDSFFIELSVENLTGHKLPTGIPLRRMWIHLSVQDQSGLTIFESGAWDVNGEIINLDTEYEKHYDIISHENQIQIYEGIMKDVDDSVTYRLLRASAFAKDNRIPPKGFTTSHSSYDSVKIVGYAQNDNNFNKINGVEGSGKDIVTYKIPLNQQNGFMIEAELCYQTVTPRFLEHLFSISTTEIDLFNYLYHQQDNFPVILKSLSEQVNITNRPGDELHQPLKFSLSQNYPNPFNPSTTIAFTIPKASEVEILIHDVLGRKVKTLISKPLKKGLHKKTWDGKNQLGKPVVGGVYFYTIKAQVLEGSKETFKKSSKLLLLK